MEDSPPDLESRNPRLGADIPHEALIPDLPLADGPRRALPLLLELVCVKLSVLIIAHPDELLLLVAAREDERAHAEDVLFADEGRVGRGCVELELVDAFWDGPDDERVELLVELLVVWTGDEGEFPFDIWVRVWAGVCVCV